MLQFHAFLAQLVVGHPEIVQRNVHFILQLHRILGGINGCFFDLLSSLDDFDLFLLNNRQKFLFIGKDLGLCLGQRPAAQTLLLCFDVVDLLGQPVFRFLDILEKMFSVQIGINRLLAVLFPLIRGAFLDLVVIIELFFHHVVILLHIFGLIQGICHEHDLIDPGFDFPVQILVRPVLGGPFHTV